MKTLVQRVQAPTPKFFKTLRNIGLILTAVATTIAAAPIALPVIVVQIVGYLTVAGGVASAGSGHIGYQRKQKTKTCRVEDFY